MMHEDGRKVMMYDTLDDDACSIFEVNDSFVICAFNIASEHNGATDEERWARAAESFRTFAKTCDDKASSVRRIVSSLQGNA